MRLVSSLDRRILVLALPAAGSTMLHVVHRIVDLAWIRELGTDAVAALTVSTVSVWMFAAVGWLVAMGLTALIARYAGAGRLEGAGYCGSQGLRWAATVGVVAGIVGWIIAPIFFRTANADPAVTEAGLAYTRVYWAGGVVALIQLAGDAIFRGHGNTATPFKIALTTVLLNVALDPVFIWGAGPIPALGVVGAAWATVTASVVGASLSVVALVRAGHLQRRRPADDALRLEPGTRLGRPLPVGLDPTIFLRMARVGLPSMAASVMFNVILLAVLNAVHAAGGSAAQAGLGIGHTGEGIAFVLGLGWSAAAASLVGRAMGAGDIRGAERAAWRAALQCAALSLLWGLVLYLFDDELAGAFAREADAQAYGASYFRIVALCLVPQAYELVLDGAFGGAGLTMPPMVIGVFFSALRIPLAWYAAFDLELGVAGIWWVIAITATLRGLACAYWFRRGTWKTRTV